MAKKDMATLTQSHPISFDGRKWTYRTKVSEVRVLARAEGYAMVQRRRCTPFVVSEQELSAPGDAA